MLVTKRNISRWRVVSHFLKYFSVVCWVKQFPVFHRKGTDHKQPYRDRTPFAGFVPFFHPSLTLIVFPHRQYPNHIITHEVLVALKAQTTKAVWFACFTYIVTYRLPAAVWERSMFSSRLQNNSSASPFGKHDPHLWRARASHARLRSQKILLLRSLWHLPRSMFSRRNIGRTQQGAKIEPSIWVNEYDEILGKCASRTRLQYVVCDLVFFCGTGWFCPVLLRLSITCEL